jgi:hypothetical protein
MEYVCGNSQSLLTASFDISVRTVKAEQSVPICEDLVLSCFIRGSKEVSKNRQTQSSILLKKTVMR